MTLVKDRASHPQSVMRGEAAPHPIRRCYGVAERPFSAVIQYWTPEAYLPTELVGPASDLSVVLRREPQRLVHTGAGSSVENRHVCASHVPQNTSATLRHGGEI